ncbi:threonine/serine exporter family protein [Bacillus sp. PS06]|uniref:threonine/serine exporter family protein n=1 Tax=Bacillus sp. PS06 TaxID=2764176 RepID=UPI00177C3EE1|nr:threonine/serine exporter family protein [Bacillus sp. PS06]MBD8070094.1 threonine/serine exporter family protein [Bacillus sp. PS06]
MTNTQKHSHDVMEVCVLAGKIMLQSGGETYRVEDTMTRIAAAYGYHHSHSFVTPTGIIFSIDGEHSTKLIRVSDRTTDLKKVTIVNGISRRISSGSLEVKAAYQELKEVEAAKLVYHTSIQIVAAAIASGCFLIMFQGQWNDFIPAMITGGIGFSSLLYLHHLVKLKFFAEFMSSALIGVIAILFVRLGIGIDLDKIIIGSVMPLVPGLLITNAVRDLIAGHLVSGISKGAEAFLTAFAIGAGIAIVFSI